LGTTSLLVYWVHIELVYGRWFGFWKQSLTVSGVVAFSAVLVAAMTLLSVLRTRGKLTWPLIPTRAVPAPSSASGD
jgi:hypothetical protein